MVTAESTEDTELERTGIPRRRILSAPFSAPSASSAVERWLPQRAQRTQSWSGQEFRGAASSPLLSLRPLRPLRLNDGYRREHRGHRVGADRNSEAPHPLRSFLCALCVLCG